MTSPFSMMHSEHALYQTELGVQLVTDSRKILADLPSESVDLIVTSPPFPLLRKKSYGNEDQNCYVAWLSEFGQAAYPCLKSTGSLVMDIGGAYQRGRPVRSLHNYRVLIEFCDRLNYRLAEEFFWFNPAKLPSPIEWVNKRKIRVKDSVNTVWWFSKSDYPKADVRNVLAPYSNRMKQLLRNPAKFYRPKVRPSGHNIAYGFARDNRGAIPSNMLQLSNTESNSLYLRACKLLNINAHPARFPVELPDFFIRFLTDPGDLVVDIFSGSNATGAAAEKLSRQWICIESDEAFAKASVTRFLADLTKTELSEYIASLRVGHPAMIPISQMVLVETQAGVVSREEAIAPTLAGLEMGD